MKIRTDFVTNSSSSGFVVIQIRLKSGARIHLEREYDTGYGGYIWNGSEKVDYDAGFACSRTGRDLLLSMSKTIMDFKEFFLWGEKGARFREQVERIADVSEINTIEMREETHFDDGGGRKYRYSFDFKNKVKEPRFVSPDLVYPSFDRKCCLYGDFSTIDEAEMLTLISKRGWRYDTRSRGQFKEQIQSYKAREEDMPCNYRLFIIGDKTAEKVRSLGFIEYANTDRIFKQALYLQEKGRYLFITESDFLKLGDHVMPWDECPGIEAGCSLVFSPCGRFLSGNSFAEIYKCGLQVSFAKTANGDFVPDQNADVIVVTDGYSEGIVPPECDDLLSAIYRTSHAKTLIVRERDFREKTAALRETERPSRIVPLICRDRMILLADDIKGAKRESIIQTIEENGGILLEHTIDNVKDADFLIYQSIDDPLLIQAEMLRVKGMKIYIQSPEVFISSIELGKGTSIPENADINNGAPLFYPRDKTLFGEHLRDLIKENAMGIERLGVYALLQMCADGSTLFPMLSEREKTSIRKVLSEKRKNLFDALKLSAQLDTDGLTQDDLLSALKWGLLGENAQKAAEYLLYVIVCFPALDEPLIRAYNSLLQGEGSSHAPITEEDLFAFIEKGYSTVS